MKKMIMVSAALLLTTSGLLAKNNFKEGNKLYLDRAYDEAFDNYSEFISKNPDRYEGYYNAGNSLYRQGKYEEALKMYEKALSLQPKDEDVKHNLEVTRKKMEEKKEQPKAEGQKPKDEEQAESGEAGDGQGQGAEQQDGKEQDGRQQAQNNRQNNGSGQAGKQKREDNADPGAQLGMSGDEVQALLNMMQKQEKQYKNYFGKQYRRKRGVYDFPDFFNMSPDEIMQYMERKMMDPFEEPQKGGKEEKDW